MTPYANFFAETPSDLLSPLTLLTRGTKNRRWNEIAIDVFTARGMTATVTHLERVGRMLNSPVNSHESDWCWRYAEPAPRGSWLNHAGGACQDCGKTTPRTFNGKYQCQNCATLIRSTVGGRKTLAATKGSAKTIAVAKESAESKPEPDTAYELRRAQANVEAFQAGQAAYDKAISSGPLTDSVAALREEVHRAA